MAIDSPKKSFSKRYGYRSQPKEITVWEDAPESLRHFVLDTAVEMAPESLRHFVLDTAVEMGYGPHALRDAICSVIHTRPDPGNWSEYPNVWGEVEGLVYNC